MLSDKIELIESNEIRNMAKYLADKGIKVTYYGKAWSNCKNNWIYFDTKIDIEKMSEMFQLKKHFEIHENLDPKSGTERGFIDQRTGEGIMGKIN